MPTRLYLITHAHTRQMPAVDAREWKLSSCGQEEARLLARQSWWKQVSIIALSTEPKTRLTVEDVLQRSAAQIVVDARFDELRRDGWVNDYTARVRTAFAEPTRPAGGWESASAALARFCTGVEQLADAWRGETLALVSHGLVLSLYRAHLLGLEQVRFDDWRELSFGAVALIDLDARLLMQDFHPVGKPLPRA